MGCFVINSGWIRTNDTVLERKRDGLQRGVTGFLIQNGLGFGLFRAKLGWGMVPGI
jgi:hypothetical protein